MYLFIKTPQTPRDELLLSSLALKLRYARLGRFITPQTMLRFQKKDTRPKLGGDDVLTLSERWTGVDCGHLRLYYHFRMNKL